jgi:3-deoxy-D-manno-octulosonic-acid transferase
LSALYGYGKIAYIGGGFGKSIHNILEAAVYGMPVIFGPRHEKFYEAKSLLEIGGAFAVNDGNELKKIMGELSGNEELLKMKSKIAFDFVRMNCGATNRILERKKMISRK